MIKATVTTTGLERFQVRMTNRVNFLGSGIRPIMNEAGNDLVEAYKAKIKSFTPGGVPDLAESTKKSKAKQVGFLYPILVRTQQFINSIYAKVTSPTLGSGWIIAIGYRGSQNGISNARLAEIHINGEGHMPKRDFTQIPPGWRRRLIDNIRDALAQL